MKLTRLYPIGKNGLTRRGPYLTKGLKMAKKYVVMEGKFIIYPFGKWWIAKDSVTKAAVMKGNSRTELMEKLLLQTGDQK